MTKMCQVIFPLHNHVQQCYPKCRILEVFDVYEATKTFDFVAFFVATF